MVQWLGIGRCFGGRKSNFIWRRGRARGVVVPGGIPEIGWIRANGAGGRRKTKPFTRRNNCGIPALVKATSISAAPHRDGREPAFAVGRHCESCVCDMVSGWPARAAASLEGGPTLANL